MNQFRHSLRTEATLLAACALLVTGCAGMNPDARETLQQPPECGQSTEQLEASHGSGMWRLGQGLQQLPLRVNGRGQLNTLVQGRALEVDRLHRGKRIDPHAIDRADVALLLTDAVEGITAQDTHILGHIHPPRITFLVKTNEETRFEKKYRFHLNASS